MTAGEVADFLRVPEATVLSDAARSWIPGRQIGGQWRFWRAAIEAWLTARSSREILLSQVGVFENDVNALGELRAAVYGGRGRPEVEEEAG